MALRLGGLSLRRRGRRVTGRHAIASQAGRPGQPDGRQSRGWLDVEADPVALLDRGHRPLPVSPCERVQDREAGADRGDLGEQPGEATDHDRKGGDRPQAHKGDSPRALGGQRGRGPRRRQRRRHRLRGPRRPPEDDAEDGRQRPPSPGEDQGRLVSLPL